MTRFLIPAALALGLLVGGPTDSHANRIKRTTATRLIKKDLKKEAPRETGWSVKLASARTKTIGWTATSKAGKQRTGSVDMSSGRRSNRVVVFQTNQRRSSSSSSSSSSRSSGTGRGTYRGRSSGSGGGSYRGYSSGSGGGSYRGSSSSSSSSYSSGS